ncbi:FAD-NAD(P)-binding protein [Rhodovulum visakhapatnamense]|uniref:FAD-NAD(P)-binding protein n=2 Tax=Rhodovulum visakhapatnamense TaxID=364297 RepID=A0A4R8FU70_9RHOB|nr:FAD-NAD(P)-binding protein [Rhodovulum visakhapatnamense]
MDPQIAPTAHRPAMPHQNPPLRLAIIGLGPRGLGALEALAARLADTGTPVAIDVFEPGPWPGAGPNFDPGQSPLMLLNIPIRAIDIDPPAPVPRRIASFAAWLMSPPDGERFPARAELGAYMAARFRALTASLPEGTALTRHETAIRRIEASEAGWRLDGAGARFGPYDEVLLAPGQPATRPDPQLARWQDHARRCGAELLPAYPADRLLEAAEGWAGKAVALRGLGLSTLDAVRLLTLGLGGRFEDGRYIASGREPARLLPFSLNGLPPWPKPASEAIDARMAPLPAETRAFEAALSRALAQPPEAALVTLCTPLARAARRVLAATGAGPGGVEEWLTAERSAPASQEDPDPTVPLRDGLAMARGTRPPAPGYAIGQIWRHWQNALRRGVNPGSAAPGTAEALIGFDEGLKRYSYGPPAATIEELAILIETGIVDLRIVDDPDILLTDSGWQLVEGDEGARADVMVDAVLPSPALQGIEAPVIAALRDEGRIVPVAKGQGARIRPDGQVIGADGRVQPGLALLGRAALGSVIAVDSIHDCFGASADRWAEGVLTRAALSAAPAASPG